MYASNVRELKKNPSLALREAEQAPVLGVVALKLARSALQVARSRGCRGVKIVSSTFNLHRQPFAGIHLFAPLIGS